MPSFQPAEVTIYSSYIQVKSPIFPCFILNISFQRPRVGFDKNSLERLEQLFRKTVGNEKEIQREDFKKIITSKNVSQQIHLYLLQYQFILTIHSFQLQPFFTERVFQIFDKDNSGTISLQEFIDAMHQFAGQSQEDKIKFLFKVYDIDGNIK